MSDYSIEMEIGQAIVKNALTWCPPDYDGGVSKDCRKGRDAEQCRVCLYEWAQGVLREAPPDQRYREHCGDDEVS